MKAAVLCAGEGRRLEPLTFARPKHLLPVAGRAVLDRVLCDLSEAGVDEAVFVVSRRGGPLEAFVGDGASWGMRTAFVVQPEPKGLADAARCAREQLGDEPFMMYLGDDLLGDGVAQFARDFMSSDAAASLICKPIADPRDFGVVVMEDGAVTHLLEKPENPPSDLAIVGVYGFGPQIWDAIERIEPSARGELEITDAIDRLVRDGHAVACHVTEGFWADAGSPEALLEANRYFLGQMPRRTDGDVDAASQIDGHVHIAAGCRVRQSRIVGPCLLGEDCVIEGSVVGPNVSLGAGCSLRDVRMRASVADEGCSITDVPEVTDSILGRDVTVQHVGTDARAMKLLLADGTIVVPATGR